MLKKQEIKKLQFYKNIFYIVYFIYFFYSSNMPKENSQHFISYIFPSIQITYLLYYISIICLSFLLIFCLLIAPSQNKLNISILNLTE